MNCNEPKVSDFAAHPHGLDTWCHTCGTGRHISQDEVQRVADRAPFMTRAGMRRYWSCDHCGAPSELSLASMRGMVSRID